jgi:hypothetical protein
MTISYTDLSDSCRPDDAFKKDFALSPQQTRRALRFPNHHTRRGTLIALPEAEAGDEKNIRRVHNDNDSGGSGRVGLRNRRY